jgi:hypothetical protein
MMRKRSQADIARRVGQLPKRAKSVFRFSVQPCVAGRRSALCAINVGHSHLQRVYSGLLLCFCRSTAKTVANIKLSSMKGVYHGIGQQIVSLLSLRHIWITATSAAIHEVPIRRSDFGMAAGWPTSKRL